MTDEAGWCAGGSAGAHDPALVLDAVMTAVAQSRDHVVAVLSPLGAGGATDDFEVVVDSGLVSRLAGGAGAGRTLRELLPSAAGDVVVRSSARALATGAVVRDELLLQVVDAGAVPVPAGDHGGDVRYVEVTTVPVAGLVAVLGRDVTDARAAARARPADEERDRRLVERSSDPILVVSGDGEVLFASPAARVVLHVEPADLVGSRICTVAHPDDAAVCAALVDGAVRAPSGGSRTARLRVPDPQGRVGWVAVTATNWLDDPAVEGVVLNVRDVTEHRMAEERLRREALQDPLTGLPNRRSFLRALRGAAARSGRSGVPFAVLLLDVDGFKGVNDTLGHPAGDELLVELATRLGAALRPSDTAARLGGDELVVIAEDLRDPSDAESVARRVLARCTGTYRLAGTPTAVTVSIGVATSAGHASGERAGAGAGEASGVEPERLLSLADAALYGAKRRGRNRIEVWGPASGPVTGAQDPEAAAGGAGDTDARTR